MVACSSSAYRVDGALLLLSGLAGGLTCEFLVEGEEGALRAVVNVACSSSAGRELGAGLGKWTAEEMGWAASSVGIGGLASFEGITCSSTSCVGVGTDVWVRLGDLVGRHFVCWRGLLR